MTGNFTVLTPEIEERLRMLENFYTEIRTLAQTNRLNEIKPIYEQLTLIDPNWNIKFKGRHN